MDINILPADTYTLTSKALFTDLDRRIITLLYQPIIGSVATSLYFTMWSQIEITLKENNHYYLMINMQVSLDTINEARKKLEGIGLLKTYVKDGAEKKIVYEMYAPLKPYDFLSSPLLGTLFANNFEDKDYQNIIAYFKEEKYPLGDFKDVTHSFSNVFHISKENVLTTLEENIKQGHTNKLDIKLDYDIKNILSLIPSEVLNKKSITKENIRLIKSLAFVYNLPEDDLKQIIESSINIAHKIDEEKLTINAHNYYDFNTSGNRPRAIYQSTPEDIQSKLVGDSNKNRMIYTFENTSPYEFLASKYDGAVPTKTDLKLMEYLLKELKFTPGVVNVLVDYVLNTNDNKLTRSYVETVAGQWKRSNIKTVSEAMELAKKEHKKNKKTKVPEWVNKDVKYTKASKEKEEQMKQMIKELVGE